MPDDLNKTVTIVVDSIYTGWKFGTDLLRGVVGVVDKFITQELYGEYTLEETLVEKIGGGPHGYGDPTDTTVRDEEHFLFPRMVWKKVRFEKCLDVTEKYYSCLNQLELGEVEDCKNKEIAMFKCKSDHYTPEKLDEIEKECIDEYVRLRSKFRETGSDDDLWKLKMLMLEPFYDKLRQYEKEGMSKEEVDAKKPRALPIKIF